MALLETQLQKTLQALGGSAPVEQSNPVDDFKRQQQEEWIKSTSTNPFHVGAEQWRHADDESVPGAPVVEQSVPSAPVEEKAPEIELTEEMFAQNAPPKILETNKEQEEDEEPRPKNMLGRSGFWLWERRAGIFIWGLLLVVAILGGAYARRSYLDRVHRSKAEIDRVVLLPADRVPAFLEMANTYMPDWIKQMLHAERARQLEEQRQKELIGQPVSEQTSYFALASNFLAAVFGIDETDNSNYVALSDAPAYQDKNNNGIPDELEDTYLRQDFDDKTQQRLRGYMLDQQARNLTVSSSSLGASEKTQLKFDLSKLKAPVSDSLQDITLIYQFTPKEIDPSASLRIKDGAWDILYSYWLLRVWANFEFAKAEATVNGEVKRQVTAAEESLQDRKRKNEGNNWDGHDKNQEILKQDFRCLCNQHLGVLSRFVFVCTHERGCKLLVEPKVLPVSEATRRRNKEITALYRVDYSDDPALSATNNCTFAVSRGLNRRTQTLQNSARSVPHSARSFRNGTVLFQKPRAPQCDTLGRARQSFGDAYGASERGRVSVF